MKQLIIVIETVLHMYDKRKKQDLEESNVII